ARVRDAVGDARFLVSVLLLNFVAVPCVVFGLSRFVADDEALLVGVLLVLLTPCVDYVIVFTGLAGGARARLLAATPWLMLVQIVLLPGYLLLFAGPSIAGTVALWPFVHAFLLFILLPLTAATLTQWLAGRFALPRRIPVVAEVAIVPLMAATL